MSPDLRSELRALAAWHTRRRAVDELLTPLLEYGPIAVERVAERLSDLCVLMADEAAAFAVFTDSLLQSRHLDAVVLDMFARRAQPPAELGG